MVDLRTLAVVPARGGSRRVPRKNLAEIQGVPMAAIVVDRLTKSGLFDSVLVSTDDNEIATTTQSVGAEVPFSRPPELSTDETPTLPVVQHAIRWLNERGRSFDVVCCVYPTAIFVEVDDLERAITLVMGHEDKSYAVAVAKYPHPIQRALKRTTDGLLEPAFPGHDLERTQDLDQHWHDAGQFYVGRKQTWLEGVPLLARVRPVEIPLARAQDIDTAEDLARARLLWAAMRQV